VQLITIDCQELDSKQKEIYNFQKVAAKLADYGYNCIKLADDWLGADFLAYHKDGEETLKVQLIGRLLADRKCVGKNLYMAFPLNGDSSWLAAVVATRFCRARAWPSTQAGVWECRVRRSVFALQHPTSQSTSPHASSVSTTPVHRAQRVSPSSSVTCRPQVDYHIAGTGSPSVLIGWRAMACMQGSISGLPSAQSVFGGTPCQCWFPWKRTHPSSRRRCTRRSPHCHYRESMKRHFSAASQERSPSIVGTSPGKGPKVTWSRN
jgi:hypothetical protein